MRAEQVDQALHKKFILEDHRLVFWHDTPGEFAEYVAQGLPSELAAVTVLATVAGGDLSTKLLLEREDPSGRYLLYSTGEPAPVEEDWLFDIRAYSAEFHADMASIWLEELGLDGLYLRPHLQARAVFLGSQARRKKLVRFMDRGDDEQAIDLRMMAVLAGAQVPGLFPILRALCHTHLCDGRFELGEPPKAIELFEKMGLAERFWALVERDFGYSSENPSMAGLLRRLFVSELFHQVGDAQIAALAHFELPSSGRMNAVVCLTQWRDSSTMAESYDAAAKAIAGELGIHEQLGALPFESLCQVFTFWEAEKRVVSGSKARVLDEALSIDVAAIEELVTERKAGHWLSGPGRELPERVAVADAHDAIVSAAQLFDLRNAYRNRLSFETPQALLSAYQKDLYRFDQLYRQFCVNAEAARGQGWDLLKTLADKVERVYDQGFLHPLGLEWGRLLDSGFLASWKLRDLPAQHRFYADKVGPRVSKPRRRAIVIISDALRYEAAQQLTETLNGRYRMNATLSAMLGVLPSYTALGMASLLPHERLEFGDRGEVLVDGRAVASTEARSKRLAEATPPGMACQANKLRAMKQDAARAFTQGKRVVYIYHNVIDARGDSASTESETFAAVEQCIAELVELVQFCVNKLNAGSVWVTADHGFLYQQRAPDITDKSALAYKPEHAVKVKKRYVIGRDLGTAPEAHRGSTKVTAGTEDAMEFWVPRGTNRFHFTGGARFVHGGAMPQEVVIPLVTVTQIRGKKKAASRIEKVSVEVLGTKHKITTPRHRFELIQTQAVGERRKPITLRAAVYDEHNEAVTSVDTATFDSSSGSIDERKRSISLTLRSGQFDKSKPYRLVLRDAETDAEVQSIDVTIDRSFDDDF